MWVIVNHLKLRVAVARQNFKWVQISIIFIQSVVYFHYFTTISIWCQRDSWTLCRQYIPSFGWYLCPKSTLFFIHIRELTCWPALEFAIIQWVLVMESVSTLMWQKVVWYAFCPNTHLSRRLKVTSKMELYKSWLVSFIWLCHWVIILIL